MRSIKRTTLVATAIAAAVALGVTPLLAKESDVVLGVAPSLAKEPDSLQARQAETARVQQERAVQVYGHARASADFTNNDVGSDGFAFRSNASRIGVQGEVDTNLNGTALFYRTEFRYELTDETDGVNTLGVEFREAFAGLKGGWGTVRIGRLSTEYKKTGTRIEPWLDNAPQARAGGRQGMSELIASFFNNAADYVTPSFGGFTANAWYATRIAESRVHNAGALRGFRGGQVGGLGVKYERGPLFLGADWLDINADAIDRDDVANGSAWHIAARYAVRADLSFAARYEDSEDIGLGKNLYVNGIYRLGGTRLIAAYGESRDRVADSGTDASRNWINWSLGAKYDLTRRSELVAAWNRRRDDTNSNTFDTLTLGINAIFSM